MTADPTPPLTIAAAARAYRTGALSPVEVTAACLDRIAARDAEIGAFATVTAERARRRARAADAEVADDPGRLRPLLGIPIGVKDIVDVAGVVTGAGCAALAGNVAARPATVWQRLEDAGAVLIGKTATHELAYGVATRGRATRSTSAAYQVGRRVGRRRRSRPACASVPWGPTPRARAASRRLCAGWWGSSRRGPCVHWTGSCRSRPRWTMQDRWL